MEPGLALTRLNVQVKKKVSAGTLDVNDCLMHMMIPTLPFGGVGHSGIGNSLFLL